MMKWLVVMSVLAGCKGGGERGASGSGSGSASGRAPSVSPDSGSAPPVATGSGSAEDRSFKALEKSVTLTQLSKDAKVVAKESWPKDDVAGLDFTVETGNAMYFHRDSTTNGPDPLSNTPPFVLFHVADDPYRLSLYRRGVGLPKGEDKTPYLDAAYDPTLEHMLRAKYALVLLTDVTAASMGLSDKKYSPGLVKGTALLYEIESNKLLGGFEFKAESSAEVTKWGHAPDEAQLLMWDLEANTRAALNKAAHARFPSAKLPILLYLK